MNRLLLNIHDTFRKFPALAWGICLILTIALAYAVLGLSYKEDISDFLPLDEKNQTALSIYQDISGSNKIYAIISTRDTAEVDPQELTNGVEHWVGTIESIDTLHYIKQIMKEVDMDKMLEMANLVYENIPYFLTEADYRRIDSLLAHPEYVSNQLSENKQLLLFPSSQLLTANIARDPLNLFTPILGRLKQAGMSIDFTTYNGYILTPDSQKAIVILESAFGPHESANNAALLRLLNEAKSLSEKAHTNLDIQMIGGPIIAASNANQIKTDSILAISIAGILIMLLLIYAFRNFRNILLILVSVGWGWMFAMGAIALYYDSISIIVIGISSVILGIAVNYPLHLIDHLKESKHPRAAFKEIISPLIVGNVTTVGAFLCLVPLNSPALRDLGLFSSLLLVGTILFVLLFLPHILKTRKPEADTEREPGFIAKLAGINIENSKTAVYIVLALTLVFGYFSQRTEFDADMRNINYMTHEQKQNMAYFQNLLQATGHSVNLYVVSTGNHWEEALQQNRLIAPTIDSITATGTASRLNEASSFFVSKAEQQSRLSRWQQFINDHKQPLTTRLRQEAAQQGFNPNAFVRFNDILDQSYEPKSFEHFKEFIASVFVGSISEDTHSHRKSLVQVLSVSADSMESVKNTLAQHKAFNGLLFDVQSLNSSIANTLSRDFNYIGIACGCIVFLFLWLSLGRIELAIVSFIPMAFSWIWILGIMGMFNIKFNIVNVILATFIFGQGDDYTIFMTEGLSHEHAYRKKLLASYKNSIVISALIMFIGIGTLLLAKHPALQSLGEVTVIGMLSVVLMAYLFPPLIFKWLILHKGHLRYRPLTLKKLLYTALGSTVFFLQLTSAYVLGFVLFVLTQPTPRKRTFFHRYINAVFRFDIRRMPGIRLKHVNPTGEDFAKPAVIICNHQSMLDAFCIMTITPKVLLLANEHIKANPIIGTIFKWCNFLTITEGSEAMIEKLKPLIAEGFSIAIFPEGQRPESGNSPIQRFHKGAFQMAHALKLDIVPVFFHGIAQIMPKGAAFYSSGTLYIEVGKRMPHHELAQMGDPSTQSKQLRAQYTERLSSIHQALSTVQELAPIVLERYLYKGRAIEAAAQRTLRKLSPHADHLQNQSHMKAFIVFDRSQQGELALLLALMYPHTPIYCCMDRPETRNLLQGCIDNFVHNVHVLSEIDPTSHPHAKVYTMGQELSVHGHAIS